MKMSDQRMSGEPCSPLSARCGSLGLLVAMLPMSVHAEGIRWLCWHDGGEAIHCFFDGAALSAAGAAAADAETARLAAELPPDLPGFVRELRLNPARFAQEAIVVPMFAPSDDAARVHELAQAVMCGSRQACSVVMSPSPLSVELLRLLDDDPALE